MSVEKKWQISGMHRGSLANLQWIYSHKRVSGKSRTITKGVSGKSRTVTKDVRVRVWKSVLTCLFRWEFIALVATKRHSVPREAFPKKICSFFRLSLKEGSINCGLPQLLLLSSREVCQMCLFCIFVSQTSVSWNSGSQLSIARCDLKMYFKCQIYILIKFSP